MGRKKEPSRRREKAIRFANRKRDKIQEVYQKNWIKLAVALRDENATSCTARQSEFREKVIANIDNLVDLDLSDDDLLPEEDDEIEEEGNCEGPVAPSVSQNDHVDEVIDFIVREGSHTSETQSCFTNENNLIQGITCIEEMSSSAQPVLVIPQNETDSTGGVQSNQGMTPIEEMSSSAHPVFVMLQNETDSIGGLQSSILKGSFMRIE
ncbi:hypothetical protein QAD02_021251 [Eretmocerus hayati]|uniref:Uncharacterized protein n=1 Tax=Eretmocerus hayati TaxID=131215 RepID=A0ACC2PQQ8_9HYME|nr:hypothetical protein QAD02_021251 [Eretmocerus hayati]